MGRTLQVRAGEPMTATIKARYLGSGGIYNVQVRLGYREGKEFFPEAGLEWAEEVRVGEADVYEFDVTCLLPFMAPVGRYDAECLIRIPNLPDLESRQAIGRRDNAVTVTAHEPIVKPWSESL